MNNLNIKLNKYNLKINSLKYLKNVIIINDKYVYKENNNYLIYEYLINRGFLNFPKPINDKDTNYELVEYIDNKDIPKKQRLDDLIKVISLLHKKTSFYKEIDLEELKKMYENIQNEANYLMNYYNDLNNIIDNMIFMSPDAYLLVRNIDLFYYLISFIKVESNNWYNNIKQSRKVRFCMVHNNLTLDHFIENDSLYLISWSKAKLDFPYKDIKKILEDNYLDLDIESVINEYEKSNKLDYNEKMFLLINLAIPKRIELTNDTYLNCYNLSNYLEYLRKIALIVQKIDKKQKQI